MTKRPAPTRLSELETRARKVRIDIAIENSPALKEVQRATRRLKRALDYNALPSDVLDAVDVSLDLIGKAMGSLGEVAPVAPTEDAKP